MRVADRLDCGPKSPCKSWASDPSQCRTPVHHSGRVCRSSGGDTPPATRKRPPETSHVRTLPRLHIHPVVLQVCRGREAGGGAPPFRLPPRARHNKGLYHLNTTKVCHWSVRPQRAVWVSVWCVRAVSAEGDWECQRQFNIFIFSMEFYEKDDTPSVKFSITVVWRENNTLLKRETNKQSQKVILKHQ